MKLWNGGIIFLRKKSSMHDMSDQIMSFTKDALVKLGREDWLTVKHFPFVLLK